MWLIGEYEAVSLFSLRHSLATASGGKTLLAPTPYAVKLALLDAACRVHGVAQAEQRWPILRDSTLALYPAQDAVVSNLFQKVLRPRRKAAAADDPDAGPFQKTIGYREYAQLSGPLGLAIGLSGEERLAWLEELMLNINYFGKRGSFMQLTTLPSWHETLPMGFVELTAEQDGFVMGGALQVMDDCSSKTTFDQVNIYSTKRTDRILRHIVLPYRIERSSRGYTWYRRMDEREQ
jgi:hypothetical protein